MRPPCRLAVVEDDRGLLADLLEYLDLRGFGATGFASAEAFFSAWPSASFDLLLLDVALPGASGLDIVRRVRAQPSPARGVGIIMLTALDADSDQVAGLDSGTDAYISKRCSLEVIDAACRSVLRRLDAVRETRATPDDVVPRQWLLDAPRWQLRTPAGVVLDLTHAELTLLAALFEEPGRTISRAALLARLGRRETLPGLRNLDNTASRLRRKVLAASGDELPVRTSYGQGYTFTGACGLPT